MTKYVDFQPRVRVPGAIDEVEDLRTEVAELKSRLEQLTKPNLIPVAPVMAKYSALSSGSSFNHPPISVNSAEARKQRVVGNALDSLVSLIQGTVATRNGQSSVVRREDAEGGLIVQISLPAAGILAPSGVSEVLQQITQVCQSEFPAARLDVLRQVSVGLGSPVSQNDGRHITTLRVLVPLPPDISPTNDLGRRGYRAADGRDDD